jgi:hypothetical protein
MARQPKFLSHFCWARLIVDIFELILDFFDLVSIALFEMGPFGVTYFWGQVFLESIAWSSIGIVFGKDMLDETT